MLTLYSMKKHTISTMRIDEISITNSKKDMNKRKKKKQPKNLKRFQKSTIMRWKNKEVFTGKNHEENHHGTHLLKRKKSL